MLWPFVSWLLTTAIGVGEVPPVISEGLVIWGECCYEGFDPRLLVIACARREERGGVSRGRLIVFSLCICLGAWVAFEPVVEGDVCWAWL